MKSSDHHPNRWIGQVVYKLVVDQNGIESQIDGKVVSYSPMSTKYLVLYSDGSSEGIPVDEIEDYVPLVQQWPSDKCSPTKKQIAESDTPQDSTPPPAKRYKVYKEEKPAVAAPVAVFQFVQDTLWQLTTELEVDDDRQRTLMATLDNRVEQPRAALARYIEEGGLDAVTEYLRKWAYGVNGSTSNGQGAKFCTSSMAGTHRQNRDATTTVTAVRAAKIVSPRRSSPCDRHLRDLLTGKCEGVFSPKRTQSKECHAPRKHEVGATCRKSHRSRPVPVSNKNSPPLKTHVVLGDLIDNEINDGEQDEDESSARRRLSFGTNSTIVFDYRDSVDILCLQLRRKRLANRTKQSTTLPQKSPEAWKSALKKSCIGSESVEW